MFSGVPKTINHTSKAASSSAPLLLSSGRGSAPRISRDRDSADGGSGVSSLLDRALKWRMAAPMLIVLCIVGLRYLEIVAWQQTHAASEVMAIHKYRAHDPRATWEGFLKHGNSLTFPGNPLLRRPDGLEGRERGVTDNDTPMEVMEVRQKFTAARKERLSSRKAQLRVESTAGKVDEGSVKVDEGHGGSEKNISKAESFLQARAEAYARSQADSVRREREAAEANRRAAKDDYFMDDTDEMVGVAGMGGEDGTGAFQPWRDSTLHRCTDQAERAAWVVNATMWAWDAYVKHAWGTDELKPVSQTGSDDLGGLGATIVDSIDTLHIMGLHSRVEKAREFVSQMDFSSINTEVSVFETTIRVQGGLLSAFQLTGDSVYLEKARDLADILVHAYKTPSGLPVRFLNLMKPHKKIELPQQTFLADFGTEQMEAFTLSEITGNATYYRKALAPIKGLRKMYPEMGLLPVDFDIETADFASERISIAACGDSYYEYLLKTWILSGKKEELLRDMWEQSMDEMIGTLVFQTPGIMNLTYIASMSSPGNIERSFHHLACFAGGMLALGVHHKAVKGSKARRYMEVAKGVTELCYQMYNSTRTGLSSESISIPDPEHTQSETFDFAPLSRENLQRPEAVESFFVLYRITGDKKYQEYAWDVFCAFDHHTKVASGGHSSLISVNSGSTATWNSWDRMQSFWLAETLKYLYLIFAPEETISLDEWVFNTEAHPLRIKKAPLAPWFPWWQ